MEIDVKRFREALADPSRREAFMRGRVAALGADEGDMERAAWKDRIERIHVSDEVAKKAEAAFDGLVKRSLKAHGEGSCMVVHAATGAGKTHLLNRLLKRPELVPSEDDEGPIRPLLYVRAPSPCNLGTLGRVLYKKLTGTELSKSTRTDDIWQRLAYQLYGQRVSVIVIDEFHHVLVNPTTHVRRATVNTVKSLVQPDPMGSLLPEASQPYPFQVVLSGIPLVDGVVNTDAELSRRAQRFAIQPLAATEEGLKDMGRFLRAVERLLAFPRASGLDDADMVRRFMKASRGYRGRAMHLLKEAAFMAIDQAAPCIDRRRHLAEIFRATTDLGPRANPFLVADVSACPNVPEKGWEELTLLRGQKDEADVELSGGAE